jgi:hypothetical protein
VDVIDVNDGHEAASSERYRIDLSPDQERTIHEEMVDRYRGDRARGFAARLGERVPEAIALEPIPEDVYSDAPAIERYDFFVIGDKVVIVEPRTREIVDVID